MPECNSYLRMDRHHMWIGRATAQHKRAFREWNQASRLEERTCRPIVNGSRASDRDEVITLVFLLDGVSDPAGRFVYFNINSRNRSAEFGYMVNPKMRNQGVGTQMLRAAVNALFLTTHLNKLYCQTGEFNVPSIRLLEKFGFHRDGILRDHHELDGRLWDDYIYSLLRREWHDNSAFQTSPQENPVNPPLNNSAVIQPLQKNVPLYKVYSPAL